MTQYTQKQNKWQCYPCLRTRWHIVKSKSSEFKNYWRSSEAEHWRRQLLGTGTRAPRPPTV